MFFFLFQKDVRKNAIMSVNEVWHTVPFFYGDPPSLIVPGLFLGNVSASTNRDLLMFHSGRWERNGHAKIVRMLPQSECDCASCRRQRSG